MRTTTAIATVTILSALVLSTATAATIRYIEFKFPESVSADQTQTNLLCWCGDCNIDESANMYSYDNSQQVEVCNYGRVNGAQFPNNYTTRAYWGGRYNLHEACNWMCMHRRNNFVYHDISSDQCSTSERGTKDSCKIWKLKLDKPYQAPYKVHATEPSDLVSSHQPDAPRT